MEHYIKWRGGFHDFVEGSGRGDIRDDAEVEVSGVIGEVSLDLSGFGVGTDNCTDGEAVVEELGEDVGADEAVCSVIVLVRDVSALSEEYCTR